MLEKYLEEFIVLNFDTIFKDSVQIYSDSEGYSGQQYQTAIGRIDVLAVDPATKDFIVIELKKGQASDKVVGQILRYMGWVKKNLCQANQNVKGLIISESRDEKLEYAISMTRDIAIRYYKLSFELTDSPN